MSILRSSLLNFSEKMESNSADESSYGLNFTRAQDRILVDHVATYPALWQPSHDHYRDNELKHRIWKDISNAVEKPVDVCKKRWKNIKDTYDRRIKLAGGRHSTKYDRGKWELNDKLKTFLQTPIERSRQAKKQEKRTCNMKDIYVEEVELDYLLSRDNDAGEPETILEESCGSETSQSVAFAGKLVSSNNTTINSHSNEENAEYILPHQMGKSHDSGTGVDLFFQSLAETVKSFPPRLQQRAKTEALKLISSLELELWNSIDL
ncbi:uncharacterized protein LOC111050673 [Nilaparvata lugens]|uniref:uncharacterized protein LOC111050673 n=1 Tax=Nilaparvata lugens TaxID=108931 RepID=UPI00193EB696|nr:uncharacterized protein LOC111050673 [Nilaparvata lugens]